MIPSEIETRDFVKSIEPRNNSAISIIGDIKGIPLPITENKLKVVPVTIAIAFQSAKAKAIAVNPDEFRHMPNFSVDKIHRSTSIPIISTELIVEEYQIYRTLMQGFDAFRIFAINLSFTEIGRFVELASRLKMAIICECVTKADVDKAYQAGVRIISVRNIPIKLSSSMVENSILLKKFIPNDCISISHGNVRNNFQVRQLEEITYDAIMLDEIIIRQIDIPKAIKELLQ